MFPVAPVFELWSHNPSALLARDVGGCLIFVLRYKFMENMRDGGGKNGYFKEKNLFSPLRKGQKQAD